MGREARSFPPAWSTARTAGGRLVTVSREGQARVWDVTGTDDAPITALAGGAASGTGFAAQVALAPDGGRAAALRGTGRGQYGVAVWNAADGREVFTASV